MSLEPTTFFSPWGFSINEGGRFFNIHISWFTKKRIVSYWVFVYIYILNWSWSLRWKRKLKLVMEEEDGI